MHFFLFIHNFQMFEFICSIYCIIFLFTNNFCACKIFSNLSCALLPFCLNNSFLCWQNLCIILCTIKLFLFMYQIKCSEFTFLKLLHGNIICTDLVLISSFYFTKLNVLIMVKYNTGLHTNLRNGNILHEYACGHNTLC